MAKDLKTNAMRILEQHGISYKEHILELKEAVDGVTCAITMASSFSLPAMRCS